MRITLAVSILLLAPLLAAAGDAMSKLEEERLDQSGTVITIVFDDSGSMEGDRINQAKAAFREWVLTVPDDYRIGLVALNAGKLCDWSRGNKSQVADAVAKIRVSGGTPLADTIGRVLADIKKRQQALPFERHVLVVFTDGEDSSTRGIAGVREELAKASRQLVETVGIAFHGHGDYMSDAATRYFDANNKEELRQGLQKVDAEIGDTKDIVISDEILREMKTVNSGSAPPAAAASVSATTPARTKSGGGAVGYIFVAVIVIFLLRRALKAFK